MHAALGLLLAVLALPAFALGLGQIRVKSKPGQPLLAEIPIITSDPTELQGLQARLASPDTFRRVGLDPPQGIVSGLRFEPALDQDGKPVIRVTSVEPVQQAELTFLVEVDWGEGRLVREYAAMVDPPRSLAAAAAPQVEAPQAAAAPMIQRPAAATAPAPQAPQPQPAEAQNATASTTSPPAAGAAPAPAPATAPPATPTSPAADAPQPSGDYAVQAGDTLSEIAQGLGGTAGYSLNQTMLALLRTNPDAFIGEDINRLRAGAVLRMPSQDELSRYSAAQATAMVREQVANWRKARTAQAQPAAATDAAAPEGRATADAGEGAKRVADARLEIAPPRSSASAQAGTQSGASAGGEGEMLRQELQQTKESLAARDAEVAELKARVAELEQLQKEQQRLIAMKDDALAGAQQRLAQTNAAQQAPAANAPDAAPPETAGAGWWWLLPLALVLGGLAWWFRRRRAAPAQPASRISDRYAAAGQGADSGAAAAPEPVAPGWAGRGKAAKVASAPAAPVAPAVAASPTWAASGAADGADGAADPSAADRAGADQASTERAGADGVGAEQAVAGQAAAEHAVAEHAVAEHASADPAVTVPAVTVPAVADSTGAHSPVTDSVGTDPADATTPAAGKPPRARRDRIELARAYANLGDRATARKLLQEVVDGDDPQAREEAARALQSL